jgi:serine/threonine-protein phosphatase PGAM5
MRATELNNHAGPHLWQARATPAAVRRLIFVRHGQYEEQTTGALTALGRKQATKTAAALSRLAVSTVWTSTLLRARQTADIVAAKQPQARLRRSRLLCEVIPTMLPLHIVLRVAIDTTQVRADKKRADEAFTTFFRPSRVAQTEIVVCHGNIIRYFVCKALNIERRLWIRLDSMHCGLTEFRVLPDGAVRVVRYNDVGHIPLGLRSEAGAPQR